MALVAISETAVAGPYAKESGTRVTTVTFSASDATNFNKIVMSKNRVLLLFQNTDVGAQTVTIRSSPDPFGRVADIVAFSIAASAFASIILEPVGWEQNIGGKDLQIETSDAGVKILAIPV